MLEVRTYFTVGLKVGHLCQLVPFSCSENHLESLNAATGTPSPPESPTSKQTLSLVNKPIQQLPCLSLCILATTYIPTLTALARPLASSISPFQPRQHHQNILRSKATLQLKTSPCRAVMGTRFHLKLPISLV